MNDIEALESIKNLAEYCSKNDDCYPCKLRPFCKSINPVVRLEYVYNQTSKVLERNLLS